MFWVINVLGSGMKSFNYINNPMRFCYPPFFRGRNWGTEWFSSVAQSCWTLLDPMDCSMPGFPVHHQLPEFTQAQLFTQMSQLSLYKCPSSGWCYPTTLSSVVPFSSHFQSFPTSVFSNESLLSQWVRWSKWSFSFSISPSNEYSGLISFRMDCFDLLAVRRTLKSLLQRHSSKASVLWCSAFFIVQLSHPFMTTGKTIALTR